MAIDRQVSPYRRGVRFEVMPIPMVAEHCIAVPAGPVQLVVESRRLTNHILQETYPNGEVPMAYELDFADFGASLHVCGPDGREHLRFDCFENEPHYHYIEQHNQANVVVRIDELAVVDPIDFSLGCVANHLPDMLRNAGAEDLADQASKATEEVHAAVAEVRQLMERARHPVG
jgi:hypothetical protein